MAFQKGNKINLGRKHSDEHNKMMSEIRKKNGCGKWNKGKRRSEETKKMMSESRRGKIGNKHSEETKKHLSEVRKKMWQDSNKRPKLLEALKKTHQKRGYTSIEIKVYDELKRLGFIFEKQKLINGKFLVDAYIPSLNLIIEADGDYWHSLEWSKNNDFRKNAYLKKCGFNIIRISEHIIKEKEFNLSKLCQKHIV